MGLQSLNRTIRTLRTQILVAQELNINPLNLMDFGETGNSIFKWVAVTQLSSYLCSFW